MLAKADAAEMEIATFQCLALSDVVSNVGRNLFLLTFIARHTGGSVVRVIELVERTQNI